MRNNIYASGGVEQSDALLYTVGNEKDMLGTVHGPGGDQPAGEMQLRRLKDLQKSYPCAQLQELSEPATALLSAGHGSGSVSLIPPGPTSPHDSQAPALRNDGANVSNGSDHISQHGGSFVRSLPAAAEPMFYNATAEPLAIPDLSDLPLDIPDMFGDLDVPSLEDLVQDVGAAEAELMATAGLPLGLGLQSGGGAGGSGGAGSMSLLRAQTLPAPSSLPLPPRQHYKATGTNTRSRLGRRNSTARQGSLPKPASGSDGSLGSGGGGRRKRKSTLETQAEKPEIPENGTAANATTPGGPEYSPFAAAASRDLPPLKKIEIDFILDDQALLDRVGNESSAFACRSGIAFSGPGTSYKPKNRSIDLAPALSLPNRHWLSPAAAIHAMHAAKPGDEDVIKWLLYGK